MFDAFWYSLTDNDFENKWEMVGWPRRISQQIATTYENLDEETDKFQRIQFNDEILLTDKIEQLGVHVAKMSGVRDFTQVMRRFSTSYACRLTICCAC